MVKSVPLFQERGSGLPTRLSSSGAPWMSDTHVIFDARGRSRVGTFHLRGIETSGMARGFRLLSSPSAGGPAAGFWGLLAPSPAGLGPTPGQAPGSHPGWAGGAGASCWLGSEPCREAGALAVTWAPPRARALQGKCEKNLCVPQTCVHLTTLLAFPAAPGSQEVLAGRNKGGPRLQSAPELDSQGQLGTRAGLPALAQGSGQAAVTSGGQDGTPVSWRCRFS